MSSCTHKKEFHFDIFRIFARENILDHDRTKNNYFHVDSPACRNSGSSNLHDLMRT